MQKKIVLWTSIVLVAISSVHCQQTKVQDSAAFRKCLVGSSGFMIGNISPHPSSFYQPNFDYQLTGKEMISLPVITWCYRHPPGIPYRSAFDAQENKWLDYFLFEPGLRFGFKF